MWDYYFHILDDAYWHDNSSHNFDLDQILSLQSDANYSNLYYDDGIAKAIRKLYLNAAPDFAYQPGRINFGDPEMLCNDYLQAQEKTVPGVKALECSAVWAAFRKRSLQAFQNPLHAGARAGGYIDFQYFDPRFGGRDDCADRNAVQIAQSKATKSWEGSEFGLAPGQPLAHTAAPPRAPAAAAQTSSRPSGRVALNRLTPLTRQTSWKSALAGVRQQPASKRRGL